jgi:hypothetical protein
MTYLPQALGLAVAGIVATIAPAQAYLDPGTGSIILQAIIGGLAMGAVTARLYWSKITDFFKRRPASPGSGESRGVD